MGSIDEVEYVTVGFNIARYIVGRRKLGNVGEVD